MCGPGRAEDLNMGQQDEYDHDWDGGPFCHDETADPPKDVGGSDEPFCDKE